MLVILVNLLLEVFPFAVQSPVYIGRRHGVNTVKYYWKQPPSCGLATSEGFTDVVVCISTRCFTLTEF